MKEFTLTTKFRGFRTKTDKTRLASGYLVEGSQNVLSTDGENVKIRPGYEILGASATALTPTEASYDWDNSLGQERNLRSYDDELEVLYNGNWLRIADGFTSVAFQFAEWWDTDEVRDMLLFVNGTPNIYAWSGAITEIGTTTTNTIKLADDTTTWAELGFISDGTNYDKKIVINGTTYTYTGGETTHTLTGVSPDPSSELADSIAIQAVSTIANKPAAGTNNDLISVLYNQLYIGDNRQRTVYVSKQNDFNTWSFSSPRLPGEGALFTLDAVPKGFVVQEDVMYITAGKGFWYKTLFQLSSDLTKESLTIKRLKTSPLQAAKSQGSITNIKNDVVFLSNEPTIDTLGRLENIETPQSKALSDAIKPTLEGYNTDNADMKFWRNNLYVALPNESLILVYNFEKKFWEAPQVLPISKLAIIGGWLYGHSNAVPETYKLFTGHNDNGNPIDAIAKFSYENGGKRYWQKGFDESYKEGYISSNTKLKHQMNLDYDGFVSVLEDEIDGSNNKYLFQPITSGSLGKNSLGKKPLAGQKNLTSELPKFRKIMTHKKQDYFEMQHIFSSNQIDADWEVLCFGQNTMISTAEPTQIKD